MSTSPEQLNGSRTMPATSNSNLEENERPKKRQRHDQPAEPEAAPAQSTSAEPAAPFEPSYFGVAPNDEFTKEVGIWLWQWSRGQKNIEIEAKIGVLLEGSIRNQNVRLNFPVATESIITNPDLARFDSNMTRKQHGQFNHILNYRVEDQASPSFSGKPVKYRHTRETDYFHPSPPGPNGRHDRDVKVRITKVHPDKNNPGLQVIKPPPEGMVTKRRIANMNVFSPKQHFDYRISVNTETPMSTPPATQPTSSRFKDRVSYEHQFLQIDLTQVQTPNSNGKPPSHELEIEFSDTAALMAEGAKEAADIRPNRYFEMIQVFLNTIRMIIKNGCGPEEG